MDISLPVSDVSASGAHLGAFAPKSGDGGSFSDTLASEMSERSKADQMGDNERPVKQQPVQQEASSNETVDPEQVEQPGTDSDPSMQSSNRAQRPETAGEIRPLPEAFTNAFADQATEMPTIISAEMQPAADLQVLQTGVIAKTSGSDQEILKEPATQAQASETDTQPAFRRATDLQASGQDFAADAATTVNTGELPVDSDRTTTSADVFCNGEEAVPSETVSKPGNTIPNLPLSGKPSDSLMLRPHERLSSSRTQGNVDLFPNPITLVDTALPGKTLQDNGKNLPADPKAVKSDNQSGNLLQAGIQDVKYTANSAMLELGSKAAKFEVQSINLDSRAAESFSIVSTGTGKTLAAQSSFKSELAAQDSTYISLASDLLAGSEEWCQDFGTKIEWMSNENVTKAELSLHPAELGVLDITINTEDDRISINIVTHNEKSREMLESSMPRLTELLKSQGLALENSNISHNSSPDQQNAHRQQSGNAPSRTQEEQQAAELGNMRSALIRHQGQIDHYV